MLSCCSTDTIHPTDFYLFQQLIQRETGIWLRESKHLMLCSRLARRLRHHGMTSYHQYYEFLQTQDVKKNELRALINCITTNKTSFFRESHHFKFLEQLVQERFHQSKNNGAIGQFRVWSAACSTGEEPYSILMTLMEGVTNAVSPSGPMLVTPTITANQNHTLLHNLPLWDLRVFATDIDTDVLDRAKAGIYDAEAMDPMPAALKRKYFLRGTGRMEGMMRIKPELRNRADFSRLNFKDATWEVEGQFDAIFCRNCLIYFDSEMQENVIRRLVRYLRPGGYLFLGHSEHMPWLQEILIPMDRTTYQLPVQMEERRAVNTSRLIPNMPWTRNRYAATMQASYR